MNGDQPTQLTTDEAAELDRLFRRLTATTWSLGYDTGYRPSRYEPQENKDKHEANRETSRREADEAFAAFVAWQRAHCPKPEVIWRWTGDEVTS